jgi:hypothetical protein
MCSFIQTQLLSILVRGTNARTLVNLFTEEPPNKSGVAQALKGTHRFQPRCRRRSFRTNTDLATRTTSQLPASRLSGAKVLCW